MRSFIAFTLVILLSACNTMQGIGKDIESLGNGIDRTAQDTKEKL